MVLRGCDKEIREACVEVAAFWTQIPSRIAYNVVFLIKFFAKPPFLMTIILQRVNIFHSIVPNNWSPFEDFAIPSYNLDIFFRKGEISATWLITWEEQFVWGL